MCLYAYPGTHQLEAPRHYHLPDAALVRPQLSCAISSGGGRSRGRRQPPDDTLSRNARNCVDPRLRVQSNRAYVQRGAESLRASSMLDVAAGILVLASVGIFLAHTLDAYRAQ